MRMESFKNMIPVKNIKSKNNKKGFTLIEVIAVIAILAIMGAILVPNVLGYRKKAQKANIQTSAKTILSAIEAYNSDKSSSDDQIIDEEGISYPTGITNMLSEEILEDDKIPACLKGDKEVKTVESLNKVASGDFSIDKFDGKASTIKFVTNTTNTTNEGE